MDYTKERPGLFQNGPGLFLFQNGPGLKMAISKWPWAKNGPGIKMALGYFKLEDLLEGFRPLMSYKLALHVIVTFTEQVVPIHKHITLF